MRKRIYAWWMKAIALVLLFVSIVVIAASGFSLAVVDSIAGVGTSVSKAEFANLACSQIFYHESYRTMFYYREYGSAFDRMEGYNLSYAIIKSSSYEYEDVDLSDSSAYLYQSDDFDAANVDMHILAGADILAEYSDESVTSDEYYFSVTWIQRLLGGGSFYTSYWDSSANYSDSYGTVWVRFYTDENGPQTKVTLDGTLAQDDADGTLSDSVCFYWVVGYLRDGLPVSDTYQHMTTLASVLWNLYYVSPVFIVPGFLIAIAAMVYLCIAAGHRKGLQEITCGMIDRIPYAILLCVSVGTEVLLAIGIYEILSAIIYYNYRSVRVILGGLLMAGMALLFYLVACLLAGTTITRCKAHAFWKNTLLYHVLHLCRKIWKVFSKACHAIGRHLPMVAVMVIAFGVVTLVEMLLAVRFWWYYEAWRLWLYFILKCGELALLVWAGLQMQRIKMGGERIAEGKLSEPIPTEHMCWEWKRHAENINKAGDGIALAVQEQMKSERFRTELITNVSHDIKTPLTSIINYVDLIKKEDITDPTMIEYIDVLDRQSARLKKLIEDLMEASKASTGNIEVNLEKCDVKVLVAQMLGEFEERARTQGLDFVIQTPEEDVLIVADGRHLWRALENLINNACKYSLAGTRVYVDVSVETAYGMGYGSGMASGGSMALGGGVASGGSMATGSGLTSDGGMATSGGMASGRSNGMVSDRVVSGNGNGYVIISVKNISRDPLNISSEELLERFVRGDSSRNTEGSGLGLSIAQSLTERMNGTLTLTVDGDLFKATLRFPMYHE